MRFWLLPVVVFLALSLHYLFLGTHNARAVFDEEVGHLPAVRQFASQWPRPNLRDYTSATTPGYHLALAAVNRFVSADIRTLRLAGMLAGLGLMVTFCVAVERQVRLPSTGRADGCRFSVPVVSLCLPLACSLYVVSAAACLSPDNAGWWSVLGMLLLMLRDRVDRWTWVCGAVLLTALVFVRQAHLWAAALVFVPAWWGREGDQAESAGRGKRILAAGLAVVPAVAVVGAFIAVWHGLTPPTYQSGRQVHTGGNPAVPAMILAVAGVIGMFYCGPLFLRTSPLVGRGRWALVGFAGGLIVGVVPHTSFDQSAGRWSGLWNIAARLPVVADRSPFIILLAGFGGAVLALFALGLSRRDRMLFAVAWLAFAAAQSANHEAWQRYYEPFCLIMFGLFAARHLRRGPRPMMIPLLGGLVLALLLGAVTIVSMR